MNWTIASYTHPAYNCFEALLPLTYCIFISLQSHRNLHFSTTSIPFDFACPENYSGLKEWNWVLNSCFYHIFAPYFMSPQMLSGFSEFLSQTNASLNRNISSLVLGSSMSSQNEEDLFHHYFHHHSGNNCWLLLIHIRIIRSLINYLFS